MKTRSLLLVLAAALPLLAADAPFDWPKAREIFQKSQNGAQLSPDEQKILDEAKRRHAAGESPGAPAGEPQKSQPNQQPPPAPPQNLVPLTDLTGKYQDQDGGLYGGGKNEPAAELAVRARQAVAQIRPLNTEGKPAADGKIVMVSLGMSNTTMEFSAFKRLADADTRKASNLVIVDCAQGGKTAAAWATNDQPWEVAMTRITAAGVTPAQVQTMWLKEANARPTGGYPAATDQLRDDIRTDIKRAREKYPNLRVIFLSSRIYAGYARSLLNPEPYAYESAFAVRSVIRDQSKDGPVLLWGPYLWTNGEKGRTIDDLKWLPEDCGPDGTHPSQKGQEKVAHLLLDFFTKNPNAKPWFAKSS
jgi:lysophospholipase L1-like esterase